MENPSNLESTSLEQDIVDRSNKSKSQPYSFLFLGILVVLCLFFLVIAFTFNKKQSPKKILTAVEPTPTIVISPASSIDEIQASPTVKVQDNLLAYWKTFSNAYLSVRFPPDVTIMEREASEIVLQQWGPTQKANTEFYDGISISIQPFELPLTAEGYAKMSIKGIEKDGVEKITEPLTPIQISDYSGFTFSVTGLGDYQTIVLKSPSNMVIVITNSTNDPGKIGFAQTVDQILNTLVLK